MVRIFISRVKKWKIIYLVNRNWKDIGIFIFVYDKIDFELKLLRKNEEDYNILIKGKNI